MSELPTQVITVEIPNCSGALAADIATAFRVVLESDDPDGVLLDPEDYTLTVTERLDDELVRGARDLVKIWRGDPHVHYWTKRESAALAQIERGLVALDTGRLS